MLAGQAAVETPCPDHNVFGARRGACTPAKLRLKLVALFKTPLAHGGSISLGFSPTLTPKRDSSIESAVPARIVSLFLSFSNLCNLRIALTFASSPSPIQVICGSSRSPESQKPNNRVLSYQGKFGFVFHFLIIRARGHLRAGQAAGESRCTHLRAFFVTGEYFPPLSTTLFE